MEQQLQQTGTQQPQQAEERKKPKFVFVAIGTVSCDELQWIKETVDRRANEFDSFFFAVDTNNEINKLKALGITPTLMGQKALGGGGSGMIALSAEDAFQAELLLNPLENLEDIQGCVITGNPGCGGTATGLLVPTAKLFKERGLSTAVFSTKPAQYALEIGAQQQTEYDKVMAELAAEAINTAVLDHDYIYKHPVLKKLPIEEARKALYEKKAEAMEALFSFWLSPPASADKHVHLRMLDPNDLQRQAIDPGGRLKVSTTKVDLDPDAEDDKINREMARAVKELMDDKLFELVGDITFVAPIFKDGNGHQRWTPAYLGAFRLELKNCLCGKKKGPASYRYKEDRVHQLDQPGEQAATIMLLLACAGPGPQARQPETLAAIDLPATAIQVLPAAPANNDPAPVGPPIETRVVVAPPPRRAAAPLLSRPPAPAKPPKLTAAQLDLKTRLEKEVFRSTTDPDWKATISLTTVAIAAADRGVPLAREVFREWEPSTLELLLRNIYPGYSLNFGEISSSLEALARQEVRALIEENSKSEVPGQKWLDFLCETAKNQRLRFNCRKFYTTRGSQYTLRPDSEAQYFHNYEASEAAAGSAQFRQEAVMYRCLKQILKGRFPEVWIEAGPSPGIFSGLWSRKGANGTSKTGLTTQ